MITAHANKEELYAGILSYSGLTVSHLLLPQRSIRTDAYKDLSTCSLH